MSWPSFGVEGVRRQLPPCPRSTSRWRSGRKSGVDAALHFVLSLLRLGGSEPPVRVFTLLILLAASCMPRCNTPAALAFALLGGAARRPSSNVSVSGSGTTVGLAPLRSRAQSYSRIDDLFDWLQYGDHGSQSTCALKPARPTPSNSRSVVGVRRSTNELSCRRAHETQSPRISFAVLSRVRGDTPILFPASFRDADRSPCRRRERSSFCSKPTARPRGSRSQQPHQTRRALFGVRSWKSAGSSPVTALYCYDEARFLVVMGTRSSLTLPVALPRYHYSGAGDMKKADQGQGNFAGPLRPFRAPRGRCRRLDRWAS